MCAQPSTETPVRTPLRSSPPMFIDHEVIRITKNGTWLSDGEEISHDQTLRAYKRNLGRDEQGYFVRLGKDFKRIEVEDCAYFVEIAYRDPEDGRIILRLSDDREIPLDVLRLRFQPGRLTHLIPGKIFVDGIEEEARFLPQAYHWTLLQLDESFLEALHRATAGE